MQGCQETSIHVPVRVFLRVEKPIGKKCIGYDQIPEHIKKSEIYSANDLGKFGNSESIPDETEVKSFFQKLLQEKIDDFEEGYDAFLKISKIKRL